MFVTKLTEQISEVTLPNESQQQSNNQSSALAANTITRSIYGHINHLISQHEASPDRLEQIFRDLQLISREDRLNNRVAAAGVEEGVGGGGASAVAMPSTINEVNFQNAQDSVNVQATPGIVIKIGFCFIYNAYFFLNFRIG